MKLFQNVLASIDGSANPTRVLELSAELCSGIGASLSVIDVVQDIPDLVASLFHERRLVSEVLLAERQTRLDELVESVSHQANITGKKVAYGRPAIELTREVAVHSHDLLIRSAAGGTPFLDSLDLRLLRHCPSALWLVDPGQTQANRRILACIDPHPASETENSFNQQILTTAAGVAHVLKSRLFIASVWNMGGLTTLIAKRFNVQSLDRYARERHGQGEAYLQRLISRCNLPNHPSEIWYREGKPSSGILAAKRSLHPDLIVMGSVAETALMGILIGSTTENVVSQAKCSILTIKPVAFESTVANLAIA